MYDSSKNNLISDFTGVYLSVKTYELFLCVVAIVRVSVTGSYTRKSPLQRCL